MRWRKRPERAAADVVAATAGYLEHWPWPLQREAGGSSEHQRWVGGIEKPNGTFGFTVDAGRSDLIARVALLEALASDALPALWEFCNLVNAGEAISSLHVGSDPARFVSESYLYCANATQERPVRLVSNVIAGAVMGAEMHVRAVKALAAGATVEEAIELIDPPSLPPGVQGA